MHVRLLVQFLLSVARKNASRTELTYEQRTLWSIGCVFSASYLSLEAAHPWHCPAL